MIYSSETVGNVEAHRQSKAIAQAGHTNNVVARRATPLI
jgi:hypothetical protein